MLKGEKVKLHAEILMGNDGPMYAPAFLYLIKVLQAKRPRPKIIIIGQKIDSLLGSSTTPQPNPSTILG